MKIYFAGVMFLSLGILPAAVQESVGATNTNVSASIHCKGMNAAPEQIEEYLSPGEMIAVTTGRSFAIRLQSNPTTGYGWQLAKPLDNRIVVLVTNNYIHPDTKLVGSGGHEVWVFKAVGPGPAEISMQYVRFWEKGRPPAETNVFKVVVK
ncbi:MAG: protease inhibitor I42 family protein [Kiritimatiellae bacterium]|nr:protease inhibitor I42 family protein [Kiritimatiellia bacterium]